MADSTTERVIAEAALAKRFESQIDERASKGTIPALVAAVEVFDPAIDGDSNSTNEIEIGVDEDGTPYFKNGA